MQNKKVGSPDSGCAVAPLRNYHPHPYPLPPARDTHQCLSCQVGRPSVVSSRRLSLVVCFGFGWNNSPVDGSAAAR